MIRESARVCYISDGFFRSQEKLEGLSQPDSRQVVSESASKEAAKTPREVDGMNAHGARRASQ
jgi:hypothetical protein